MNMNNVNNKNHISAKMLQIIATLEERIMESWYAKSEKMGIY